MSYTNFVHLMHKSLITKPLIEKKHIIRFTCKREYDSCMSYIKKLKPTLTKLNAIQPIYTLNAICCSLHSYKALRRHKGILFIEEDYKIKFHHHFSSHFAPLIPWGVKEINSPQAWRNALGRRVKVAVIDTGADFSHPDLRSSLAGGVNFIQRFHPAYDDNGHGSHIAGTIAAGSQMPKRGTGGIIGVAPRSLIYAVKSFDHNGSAFVSDIILGVDWCVRNKMDIINMSFGMKNKSLSLRDAIRVAHDAGIIVVASSGNDGKASGIDYPARFTQTVAVGATDRNKRIAAFSNRGKGITIYAPGDKIYSTWKNSGYHTVSGTSMATSHVTGVIALLLSVNPGLSTNRIKALLRRTASPIKGKSMIGEVDAQRAIQACLKRK